jgi:small subunit ribosomal protein S18
MRGERSAGKKDKTDRPRRGMFRRKRVCRFCVDKVDYVDYKDVRMLISSIPERGKIQPRRLSGTCAKHQRTLQTAIKRARHLALIPFVTD